METSRNVQVSRKFLNRHSIHNQMDLIVITIDPRQQKRRCGKCSRCLAEECGTCKPCKDKPKFGGKGVQKHCCIHRQCVEISSKGASMKVCVIYCSPEANTQFYICKSPSMQA